MSDAPAPYRPASHIPTDESRARVRDMLGAGRTRREVAAALGISDDTLRSRYPDELAEFPPPQNPPPEGGKFRPGQSGNPTGETRATPAFRKACRDLADEGLAEARRRLLDSKTPGAVFVALWAALRDTGYGKPKESIQHTGPDDGPIQILSITTNDPVEASKAYQRLMGDG